VRVILVLNIIFLSACSDTASDTQNPVINSKNIPIFITDRGEDLPASISINLMEDSVAVTELELYAEDNDGDSISWTN